MRSRNRGRSLAMLAVAVAILFFPFATASNADRATQTVTLLSLCLGVFGVALTWLALRPRGYVRSGFLALGGLVGSLLALWTLGAITGVTAEGRALLISRILLIGMTNFAGLWTFIIALRRLFPRRNRGVAAGVLTLLIAGLFPGPTLLLQPAATALNVTDVGQQLRAGYLFWTVGTALMIAPFWAAATLPGDWFERWWSDASRRVMAISDRRFAVGVFVITLALGLFFAFYCFEGRPTTADEIAQLWHGRILLSGRLALPPDPNPEFFAIDNIIDRPVWMSQFPIGGPLIMAIGLALHVTWLLNPLLTAVAAFCVYRFTRRAYGEMQARVAAMVFMSSPMLLILGGSQMNHTATMCLIVIALAALPSWVTATDPRIRLRTAAIIGVSVGCAIAIRPLDGVVAGAVFGILMLGVAVRDRGRTASLVAAMAAGAIPVGLLLVANWRTTGSPTRFGYEMLWGPNHSLGLHDDPTGHPHTPWRALLLGIKYAAQLNWIALTWPVPVILVVTWGLLTQPRPRRWDIALLSLFGVQLFVYAFYWHDGQFVGPRFVFAALPALLILAARAPVIATKYTNGLWRRIAIITIPACIAVSWMRYMPPFGVRGIAREFHQSRRGMKRETGGHLKTAALLNALVFVQEGASTRVLRRMWGLGLSRASAARLLERSETCSLLEAIRAEESITADTTERLRRIQSRIRRIKPSRAAAAVQAQIPDPNFKIDESTSLTPACKEEIRRDRSVANSVAYGPLMLDNTIDADGRIGGDVVFVIDLGERNELLRTRFGNRRWYRVDLALDGQDTVVAALPYEAARPH